MPGRDASLSSDHVRKAAVNAPRHKERGAVKSFRVRDLFGDASRLAC